MKYNSTRGGVNGLSFEDSILSGFASDGGILLPESIPRVSEETIQRWSGLSYVQLFKEVLSLFISEDEIPKHEIAELVDDSFRQFDCPDVVKLVKPLNQPGIFVAELWHGSTGAFKDIALSVLGQCIERVLRKRQCKVTILVGTSGDTGSSAIHSVQGLLHANIIVLYPHGRVTEIQRLQMTTVNKSNVRVFGVDGTSDDLDVPIKRVFSDNAFVKRHNLCSINSINVGRVLFQCVHYLFCYFQAAGGDLSKTVKIYIPTGAGGNVCGGVIARQLCGLDIQLVMCVNENDILHRWIETGKFSPSAEVFPTSSSAMDIQSPYNIDRLLYFLSGGDAALIRKLMKELEDTGSFNTPQHLRDEAQKFLSSRRVTEAERMSVMKSTWSSHKYLLCPHTAVGVHAACQDVRSGTTTCPAVCIATATAFKFPESVEKAGITDLPSLPPSISQLFGRTEHQTFMQQGEDWEEMLRKAIETSH